MVTVPVAMLDERMTGIMDLITEKLADEEVYNGPFWDTTVPHWTRQPSQEYVRRRVQVLEGPVVALDGDDADTAMARLGLLPEWTSSFHSGSELLPEIAAAMRGS